MTTKPNANFKDLVGARFGRLTVLSREPNAKGANHTRWRCVCDCGGVKVAHATNLRRGLTMSCGCYNKQRIRETAALRERHGHASGGRRSPTYSVWQGMIKRTTDANSEAYRRYGAVGRGVCDRWRFGEEGLSGFQCFLVDMGERPVGMTLDRIDNDGNYEPRNCRWADVQTQSRNKANTKLTVAGAAELSAAALAGENLTELAEERHVTPGWAREMVGRHARDAGLRRQYFWVSEEATVAIAALAERYGTPNAAVQAAILALAAQLL